MTTMTGRQFNQDVSAAKRAAKDRPVVITDRGRPSHVLMSYEEYQRLLSAEGTVWDWLAMDEDDLEFEPGRVDLGLQAADL